MKHWRKCHYSLNAHEERCNSIYIWNIDLIFNPQERAKKTFLISFAQNLNSLLNSSSQRSHIHIHLENYNVLPHLPRKSTLNLNEITPSNFDVSFDICIFTDTLLKESKVFYQIFVSTHLLMLLKVNIRRKHCVFLQMNFHTERNQNPPH